MGRIAPADRRRSEAHRKSARRSSRYVGLPPHPPARRRMIETFHVTDIRELRENLKRYPRWRAHALATLLNPIERIGLRALLATEKEDDEAFYLGEALRFTLSSKPVRPQTYQERYRPRFRDWVHDKFVPWQPSATITADELGVLLWLLVQRLGVEEKAGLQTLAHDTGLSRERVAGELLALRVFAVYNAIGDVFDVGPAMVIKGWFLTATEALAANDTVALGSQRDHDWVRGLLPKVLDASARKTGCPRPNSLDSLTYDPQSLIACFRAYAAGFKFEASSGEEAAHPGAVGTLRPSGWAGSAVKVFKTRFEGKGNDVLFDTVVRVELGACHILAVDLIKEYGIRQMVLESWGPTGGSREVASRTTSRASSERSVGLGASPGQASHQPSHPTRATKRPDTRFYTQPIELSIDLAGRLFGVATEGMEALTESVMQREGVPQKDIHRLGLEALCLRLFTARTAFMRETDQDAQHRAEVLNKFDNLVAGYFGPEQSRTYADRTKSYHVALTKSYHLAVKAGTDFEEAMGQEYSRVCGWKSERAVAIGASQAISMIVTAREAISDYRLTQTL